MCSRRYLSFFALCAVLSIAVKGQQKPSCSYQINPLILTGSDPVFIGYVKSDQTEKDAKRKEPIVWLRLHNNTKWAIHLVATGLTFDGYSEKYDKIRLCNGEVDGLLDQNRVWLFYTLRKDGIERNPFGNGYPISQFWLPSDRTVIFPEGTRSRDGKIQPARPGIGMIIAKTLVPVVPMRIFGSYEAWPKGGKLRPHRLMVVVGKPIRFAKEDLTGNNRETYQRISERVLATIAAIQSPD